MSRSLLFLSLLLLSLLLSAAAHGGHHDSGGHDDSGSHDDSGGGDSDHDLRSAPLIGTKIWCLIIVFIGTFAAGISPYFLKWDEAFLVLGTQFAGGVFLGTALMHFLSDANETFRGLTEEKYPFAFMLASAGYLLTMLGDCAVGYVYGKRSSKMVLQGDTEQGKGGHNGTTSHSQFQDTTVFHSSNTPPASVGSLGDIILLLIALCFHSVFEGIAIGISETKSDAWRALWTVSLHKIFAAIAMGIALLQTLPNCSLLSCVAYVFAFSISSPVGVTIGIIIDATTEGAVADWIYAISMGLACGVFIYVSINHLLSKGYIPKNRISVDTPQHKFLAVLVGVGVIAVVMVWDS